MVLMSDDVELVDCFIMTTYSHYHLYSSFYKLSTIYLLI